MRKVQHAPPPPIAARARAPARTLGPSFKNFANLFNAIGRVFCCCQPFGDLGEPTIVYVPEDRRPKQATLLPIVQPSRPGKPRKPVTTQPTEPSTRAPAPTSPLSPGLSVDVNSIELPKPVPEIVFEPVFETTRKLITEAAVNFTRIQCDGMLSGAIKDHAKQIDAMVDSFQHLMGLGFQVLKLAKQVLFRTGIDLNTLDDTQARFIKHLLAHFNKPEDAIPYIQSKYPNQDPKNQEALIKVSEYLIALAYHVEDKKDTDSSNTTTTDPQTPVPEIPAPPVPVAKPVFVLPEGMTNMDIPDLYITIIQALFNNKISCLKEEYLKPDALILIIKKNLEENSGHVARFFSGQIGESLQPENFCFPAFFDDLLKAAISDPLQAAAYDQSNASFLEILTKLEISPPQNDSPESTEAVFAEAGKIFSERLSKVLFANNDPEDENHPLLRIISNLIWPKELRFAFTNLAHILSDPLHSMNDNMVSIGEKLQVTCTNDKKLYDDIKTLFNSLAIISKSIFNQTVASLAHIFISRTLGELIGKHLMKLSEANRLEQINSKATFHNLNNQLILFILDQSLRQEFKKEQAKPNTSRLINAYLLADKEPSFELVQLQLEAFLDSRTHSKNKANYAGFKSGLRDIFGSRHKQLAELMKEHCHENPAEQRALRMRALEAHFSSAASVEAVNPVYSEIILSAVFGPHLGAFNNDKARGLYGSHAHEKVNVPVNIAVQPFRETYMPLLNIINQAIIRGNYTKEEELKMLLNGPAAAESQEAYQKIIFEQLHISSLIIYDIYRDAMNNLSRLYKLGSGPFLWYYNLHGITPETIETILKNVYTGVFQKNPKTLQNIALRIADVSTRHLEKATREPSTTLQGHNIEDVLESAYETV